MIQDPKPFASLSSSLLARKGMARPAMRRQTIDPARVTNGTIEDLGWNDMGEPAAPVAPVHLAPLKQVVQPEPARSARVASGSRGTAAFTLRLDSDRHLRLRLLCALSHRSAQKILIEALDELLARHVETALPFKR